MPANDRDRDRRAPNRRPHSQRPGGPPRLPDHDVADLDLPLAWTFFTALRPISDTIKNGYWSWPTTLNFQNFIDGWTNANLGYYYLNTLIVAVPA